MRRLCLLLLLVAWPATAEDVWTGVDRVVAVGDVHGDYDQFVAVLRSADLIDAQGKWSGGKTHLVQTGDILDRGPDSRKAMDLLMHLEEEAPKAGGAVHALIGNHEAMNMYGDLRYVVQGEIDAFKEGNSDGLAEHRAAFSAKGKYGKWILGHNAVIQIDSTLFLHGGISPKYADWTVRRINDQVRAELSDFSRMEGGIVQDSDGPLWYRGLATGGDEEQLRKLLFNYKVDRIVIGHTFTDGAITPRFDGKVIQIDIGLSRFYDPKGRMACLVIEKGKPHALHRGRKVDLPWNGEGDRERYEKQTRALDLEALKK
ncbi:MAG: metallophosphoesterase [Planctomycetes bacterium]|nr:metallophosphoesterase [Planctomycetota bacterium]